MKTSVKYLSLVVAAITVGVALFKLASASFSAAFRGDVVAAIIASAAIVGFAIYDYSRRTHTLSISLPVLRPSLPVASLSNKTSKGTAYGIGSSGTDRLAA